MKLSTVVEESLGEGESVLAYSQSTIFSQIPLLCFALFFFCGAAVVVNVLTKGIAITDRKYPLIFFFLSLVVF